MCGGEENMGNTVLLCVTRGQNGLVGISNDFVTRGAQVSLHERTRSNDFGVTVFEFHF